MFNPNKTFPGILMLLTLFIFPFCTNAQGWVIEEENGTISYISGNWLKVIESEEDAANITIFNFEERLLIMADMDSRQYAEGTLSDYCEALKKMTNSMMEGMTPEQREMMEAYMEKSSQGPPPAVTTKKMGAGENIAGYKTEKIQVFVDGELYEELWISKDSELKELIAIYDKGAPVIREMVGCSSIEINMDNDPAFSEAYTDLLKTGFEMKSISYEYGTPNPGTDIISIEKKNIPSAEFTPPAGFTKVDFSHLMAGFGGDEEEEEE